MSRILQLLSRCFTTITGFVLLRREGGRYADARRALDYIARERGPEPLTVLDIGAHRGGFASAWLQARPGDRLLCIEPNQSLREEFWRSVNRSLQVRLYSLAIADATRIDQINICRSTATSSLLQPRASVPIEYRDAMAVAEVRNTHCETLDHFLSMEGIPSVDVIKMDVQGGESAVLRGGQKALAGASYVIIELQFQALYEGVEPAASLLAALTGHGFRLVMLYDLNYNRAGELMWADGLFARAGSGKPLAAATVGVPAPVSVILLHQGHEARTESPTGAPTCP